MSEHDNAARLLHVVAEGELPQPDILDALMDKIDALTESHSGLKDTCNRHFNEEDDFKWQVQSAFPGGDMSGHRIYHEALIEQARARRDFWRKMTFELTKWTLIGFVGWIVVQAWIGLLKGPK